MFTMPPSLRAGKTILNFLPFLCSSNSFCVRLITTFSNWSIKMIWLSIQSGPTVERKGYFSSIFVILLPRFCSAEPFSIACSALATASVQFNTLPFYKACWLTSTDQQKLEEFIRFKLGNIANDKDGHLVYLAQSEWFLNTERTNNPQIEFHFTSEIHK